MKLKLRIPTTLKDIKLSQWQKYIRTTEGSEDARWVNRQLVGIFCDVPDNIVDKIPKRDFDSIVETISKIVDEKPELQKVIKHKGKEYGFIPKLDDITVGEQADIDSMLSDWSKMDLVMGIMYRPTIVNNSKGYLIEDYKEGVKLDLTMDVVQGAVFFLHSLMSDLLSCTQNFIREEIVTKNLQTLEENGVGIAASINSLEGIFSDFQRLVSYDYTKPSCI